jgi:AraC family transcriptional regulator of adaptative response / DNA-3-methyladenine glycosylase II
MAARAVPGLETVDGRRLRRALRVTAPGGKPLAGWIEARPAPRGAGIEVRIDARLTPAIPRVLAACKRAFDLDCQPQAIASALGALAVRQPGLRLPGAFDGFEFATRAILGQQISVEAARTLARRLLERFGTPIETPFAGVNALFPEAARLADCAPAALAALGIVATRARAIVALAHRVAEGRIALDVQAPVEQTLMQLRALPGIGDWTAQTIAMRALHWPDAFPPGDVGVMKALGLRSVKAAEALAEAWRPWRSYAVMHLWQNLEDAA